MEKGRFGFCRWLYPFVSLWMVLVGPTLGSLLILGFVVIAEQDEWTVKQCLHVVMLDIYWGFYQAIMGLLAGIPLVGYVIAVIQFVVFLIMLALVLVLGLGRLKQGRDMALPGKGIVNRAYGVVQASVMPKVKITFESAPRPQPPGPAPAQQAGPEAEAPAPVQAATEGQLISPPSPPAAAPIVVAEVSPAPAEMPPTGERLRPPPPPPPVVG